MAKKIHAPHQADESPLRPECRYTSMSSTTEYDFAEHPSEVTCSASGCSGSMQNYRSGRRQIARLGEQIAAHPIARQGRWWTTELEDVPILDIEGLPLSFVPDLDEGLSVTASGVTPLHLTQEQARGVSRAVDKAVQIIEGVERWWTLCERWGLEPAQEATRPLPDEATP